MDSMLYGSVLLAGLCSQARYVTKQGPGGFHMFVLSVASWFTILVRWVIYIYYILYEENVIQAVLLCFAQLFIK